ncbi:unnamed protein product [Danaus chrysippus]|uniref:(African queen) hypothetical protein n=1 Tax=Danaus chrysippus TaxID=151541 RepID=A0A8J2W525_9NEOP|nr:unnamed protein product [Danaus chrysippus]
MGTAYGARPPSNTAYFVALAGVLSLLLLLCCYFIYFCIRRVKGDISSRVKELSQQPLPSPVKSVRPPPPTSPPCTSPARSFKSPTHYPVQPSVRESATAMARLCQLPPSQTDTVHPKSPRTPRTPGTPNIPGTPRTNRTPNTPQVLPPPRILKSPKHLAPSTPPQNETVQAP